MFRCPLVRQWRYRHRCSLTVAGELKAGLFMQNLPKVYTPVGVSSFEHRVLTASPSECSPRGALPQVFCVDACVCCIDVVGSYPRYRCMNSQECTVYVSTCVLCTCMCTCMSKCTVYMCTEPLQWKFPCAQ
eukprot:jgi/Botrbrau1/3196/Bobra.37_2s0026.1